MTTTTRTPQITLYFLQASRSIRIAWLLEELGLPYNVEFSDRLDRVKQAPADFKAKAGNPLGKFPTLRDGEVTVWESGAIVDYLLNTYDTSHALLPLGSSLRTQTQIWIHAAEGTFMLHALAITYAQWNFPSASTCSLDEGKRQEMLDLMTNGMSKNVQNDFDWLESTLHEQEERLRENGKEGEDAWLVGDGLTAADVMMEFSVDFILARGLGVQREGGDFEVGGRWGRVRAWLERCHAREEYRRAVDRTGYTLHPI